MSRQTIPNPGATGSNRSTAGPTAHEDLTIAEILESMRVPSEERPGKQCFVDGNGRRHWVSNARVSSFTAAAGALHPSNYLSSNGIAWDVRFFSPRARKSSSPNQPPVMKHKAAIGDAATATAALDTTLKPLGESAAAVYGMICKETNQFVSHASEKIRANPVPAVLGAAMFGAAACYFILSGRREAPLQERLVFEPLAEAAENANATLRSIYDNLKFW